MWRLDIPNEPAWRFWRLRRAFGVVRMALVGVVIGLIVHVLQTVI